ncbi:unnamed protein product [Rangifer tarandus platyrhynchus]|uniref:Uncharacterized protein n=1 Tax=Rangifer tarandus platyrhynchus TaxID=3082113 RepID=A0ABN8XKQ8_RANTA|nr:unnamed protein product [Rangifer tarandus platyrhynchus]
MLRETWCDTGRNKPFLSIVQTDDARRTASKYAPPLLLSSGFPRGSPKLEAARRDLQRARYSMSPRTTITVRALHERAPFFEVICHLAIFLRYPSSSQFHARTGGVKQHATSLVEAP